MGRLRELLSRHHKEKSNGCKTAFSSDQIGPDTKRVRLGTSTFPQDFFKTIAEHDIDDVSIKSGEQWQGIFIEEISDRNVKVPDSLLRQLVFERAQPSSRIVEFLKTPDFFMRRRGQKDKLVVVTGEQLMGEPGDDGFEMSGIVNAANAVGLKPCLGSLGYEFEETYREKLNGARVIAIAKPSETRDDMYALSLHHSGERLELDAQRIGVDSGFFPSGTSFVFTIPQKQS